MALKTSERKTMIDHLVANSGGWGEEDRPLLNGLKDERLIKLVANSQKTELLEVAFNAFREVHPEVAELTVNEMPSFIKEKMAGGDEEEEDDEEEVVAPVEENDDDEEVENSGKKKPCNNCEETMNRSATKNRAAKSTKEWLAEAPEEIRTMVANNLRQQRTAKENLIKKLTANVAEPAKKNLVSVYSKLSVDDLTAMVENRPTSNSAGTGGDEEDLETLLTNWAGAAGGPALVGNSGEGGEDDDLLVPPSATKQKQTA